MYHVYVMKSLRNNKRYTGSTKLLPEERVRQHNYGSNNWSKHNGPFELIYKEPYSTPTEARKREIFFKSGVGRKLLDEILRSRAVGAIG